MNNNSELEKVPETKQSQKSMGSGQMRALYRAMDKLSWQADYYKDTPKPTVSRQQRRKENRVIAKAAMSIAKKQVLKKGK
jgi:hypothetical protein